MLVDVKKGNGGSTVPSIKVTGMPGKHVPPGPWGVVGKMNDLLNAVSSVSWG